MIKIKIYRLAGGYRNFNNTLKWTDDYCYCVFVFGILLHSVTILGIPPDDVSRIFGGKKIQEQVTPEDDE